MNSPKTGLIHLCFILALFGCGKKTQEKDPVIEKNYPPSHLEVAQTQVKDLRHAVINNDVESARQILDSNSSIDLNTLYEDGETLFTAAIKNQYPEMREFLIERGVNLDRSNINLETPLILAAKLGDVSSLKRLLSLGVILNKKDADGNTARHCALMAGTQEQAMLLINSGANFQLMNYANKNAYQLAVENQADEVLELLQGQMKIGSGFMDKEAYRTILIRGNSTSLNLMLTRFPTIVYHFEDLNPLIMVLKLQNNDEALLMTDLLLASGANVNGVKSSQTTPLIEATKLSKENFASLYLTSFADPNIIDGSGKSALIYAVEGNHLGLVKLLSQHSALEKYSFHKDNKFMTMSACAKARDIKKELKEQADLETNAKIRNQLRCGLKLSRFF